jgi:hypothetical protein
LLFDIQVCLDERSEDGFEDGLVFGIKLGIHSTAGVKLGMDNSPEGGWL